MRTHVMTLIVAAALITGCGPGDGRAESPAVRLPAGAYEVAGLSGDSPPGLDTARITVTVTADGLTAGTGCNTLTGRARLDGDRLVVEDLSTTDLPCADGFIAAQRWLTTFLEDRPTVTVHDGQLTLATARTTVRLRPTGPAASGPASPPGPPPTAPRTG